MSSVCIPGLTFITLDFRGGSSSFMGDTIALGALDALLGLQEWAGCVPRDAMLYAAPPECLESLRILSCRAISTGVTAMYLLCVVVGSGLTVILPSALELCGRLLCSRFNLV